MSVVFVATAAMFLTMLQHHQLKFPICNGLSQSEGTTLGIVKQKRSQMLFSRINHFGDACDVSDVLLIWVRSRCVWHGWRDGNEADG